MRPFSLIVVCCIVLLASSLTAQEVVIPDFPLGVSNSASHAFFEPYMADLKALVDTLNKYPEAQAVVTGGADGNKYHTNHDAMNPGLSLGRAHMLRNLLIFELGVDSTRIAIRTKDVAMKGGQYRFASLKIIKEPPMAIPPPSYALADDLADLQGKIAALEAELAKEPAVVVEYDTVQAEPSDWSVFLGAGVTTSPYGGIPMVNGALCYKHRVYVEMVIGHSFWDDDFKWVTTDTILNLDTKRRMTGAYLVVYPKDSLPVGVVGGWIRVEEMSQYYYEYVRLSEGVALGLQARPWDFLSVTGLWNPAKRRTSPTEASEWKADQFMLNAALQIELGGVR